MTWNYEPTQGKQWDTDVHNHYLLWHQGKPVKNIQVPHTHKTNKEIKELKRKQPCWKVQR